MILDKIRARQQRDEALYEETLQQISRNEERKQAEEDAWGWPEDDWQPVERDFSPEQTALLESVWDRALCAAASPLLFKDDAAERIVEQYQLAFPKAKPDAQSYLQAIAQHHFVDTARVYLKRNAQATVVDLGCGLSTTLRRLDNKKLRWYNVDSANTLQLRSELGLDTTGRIKNLAGDPSDPFWMDQIHFNKGKGMIVIANNTFSGLPPKTVKSLLVEMQGRFPDTLVMFTCIGGDAAKSAHMFRLYDLNAKAVFHAWLDKPSTRVYETSKLVEEFSKAPDIDQRIRRQLARCYSTGEQILVDLIF